MKKKSNIKTIQKILLLANLIIISSIAYAQKNVKKIDSICEVTNLKGKFRNVAMKGILGEDMSNSATFYLIDSAQKQIRKASFMRKGKADINFYFENKCLIKVEETKGSKNGDKILRSYYFHNKILIHKKGYHKKFMDTKSLLLKSDSLLNDKNMIQYFDIIGINLSQ